MSISAVNTEGDTARRYTDMSVQTSPSLLPILHKTPHPQSNVERIYPQTSHFRDASSDSDYASLISGTSFLSSGFDNTSDLRSSSLESFPSSQEWNDIVPSSKIRKPYSLHPVRRVPSTPFHSKLFSNSYSSRTVSLPERSSLKSSFAAIIPSPRTVSLPIQLTEGPFSNLSDISESSFSVSEPSFTTHSAPNPQTPTKRDVRYTHDLIDLRTPSPALSPPISYLGSFAAGSASPSLSFVDASTFDDDSVVFVSEDLTIPRSPVAEHPPPSALAVQLEPAPSSNEIHADKYGWLTWNSPPKPIPALHGPLSLPYARCPSGAEGTLFHEQSTTPHPVWGLDTATEAHRSNQDRTRNHTALLSPVQITESMKSTKIDDREAETHQASDLQVDSFPQPHDLNASFKLQALLESLAASIPPQVHSHPLMSHQKPSRLLPSPMQPHSSSYSPATQKDSYSIRSHTPSSSSNRPYQPHITRNINRNNYRHAPLSAVTYSSAPPRDSSSVFMPPTDEQRPSSPDNEWSAVSLHQFWSEIPSQSPQTPVHLVTAPSGLPKPPYRVKHTIESEKNSPQMHSPSPAVRSAHSLNNPRSIPLARLRHKLTSVPEESETESPSPARPSLLPLGEKYQPRDGILKPHDPNTPWHGKPLGYTVKLPSKS